MDLSLIKSNYQEITEKIYKKQQNAKITIVAVTKQHPLKKIKEAYKSKIVHFGENKIQEAKKKFENLTFRHKITLHLIGHLQTNKVKKAVKLFDVIHTVDSSKLAEKINKESEKLKKKQTIFIQINISSDKKKFGVPINRAEDLVREIKNYKFLAPTGIMVITKKTEDKQETKQYFKKAKKMQHKIQTTIDSRYTNLSMGMSDDYLLGVELGATHIRIGTAIFGGRNSR